MKKYMFGLMAVMIALASIAFKPRALQHFKYVPPTSDDYSLNSVENRANWTQTTVTCSNNNVRACTFKVDDAHIESDGTLKSSVVINAQQGPVSGKYYVIASGSSNLSNIVNKQND